MPTVGYDYLTTVPSTFKMHFCRVCHTRCEILRSQFGATSFTAAVMGDFEWYDAFVCPYADWPWHNKAMDLLMAIDRVTDAKTAQCLIRALDQVLRENGLKQ